MFIPTWKCAFVIVLSLALLFADAYVITSPSRSTFVGQLPATKWSSGTFSGRTLRMDLERDVIDIKARYTLERTLQRIQPEGKTLSQAQAVFGMPWKSSIDPKVTDEELLYMPFWEWTMSFMEQSLTNLRVEPSTNGKTDFGYNENAKKKARIVNLVASSDEYRKIRMTYYDAGDNCQVFNTVWYPDPKYNLPILGVDLLSFNRKKYLAIVDFQPIHSDEEDHAVTFEDRLRPIKDSYETLKGRMSSKFYDETQFFSKQMLFSRFEDEGIISRDLFPAFQSYVQTHLDLIRETNPNESDIERVLQRHEKYDTYSAERDPAIGLFCSMFGSEWAMDYVHDFLFSLSERNPNGTTPPAMPMFGGPPPAVVQSPEARAPVTPEVGVAEVRRGRHQP